MRKWERAGMRNKNKPPKQNPMRNQEKEGMKEERAKKSTKRKKRITSGPVPDLVLQRKFLIGFSFTYLHQ